MTYAMKPIGCQSYARLIASHYEHNYEWRREIFVINGLPFACSTIG
jgi:hypothetical protein